MIKCKGCNGEIDYRTVTREDPDYYNAGPALVHLPVDQLCRWYIEIPSPQIIAYIKTVKDGTLLRTSNN